MKRTKRELSCCPQPRVREALSGFACQGTWSRSERCVMTRHKQTLFVKEPCVSAEWKKTAAGKMIYLFVLFLFYFLYTKRRQFIQKKKRQRKTLDIQLHFCVFFTTLILRGLAFVDTAAKSLKLYMNATLSCSVWPHQRWHRPLSVSCSIGRRTPRINDVSWRLQYHVKVHTQMLIHYVKTNKWKNKREREIKMLFFSTEWTGR